MVIFIAVALLFLFWGEIKFLIAVGVLVWLASGFAHAQGVNPFEKWLNSDAPDCVNVSEFKDAGAKVITLNHDQFEFVRALWIAVPPISRSLPAGNLAIEVVKDGQTMLSVVSKEGTLEKSCARFLAPDFIVKMLDDVAIDVSPRLGEPL